MYGWECLGNNKGSRKKVEYSRMKKVLRWICGKTRKDKPRQICYSLGVAQIKKNVMENWLWWHGYSQWKSKEASSRRSASTFVLEDTGKEGEGLR